MWANKPIDRLTDTHAYRQTNRQIYGQTERRTETQTDNGQTDRLQTDTQTHMQLNRRTDGQTDRQTETDRKKDGLETARRVTIVRIKRHEDFTNVSRYIDNWSNRQTLKKGTSDVIRSIQSHVSLLTLTSLSGACRGSLPLAE